MSDPVKIGNLLAKNINRAGLTKQVEAARICDSYHCVLRHLDINQAVLQKTQAVYYRYKILTVAVLGASWAQELQMRRHLIIRAINKQMGRPVVHRIVFQIG